MGIDDEREAMKERMKGKAFPFAPTGCSPPPFLLPYGSQGEVAGAVLPIQCCGFFFPEPFLHKSPQECPISAIYTKTEFWTAS